MIYRGTGSGSRGSSDGGGGGSSSDSSRAAGNKVRRKSASRAGCVGETHNNNKEPGRSGSTSGR